jgi:hypothetical protein
MITSLKQFTTEAKRLNASCHISDMYDVFEYQTSDELRNQVYELADPTSPEPFRSAMHNLGFTNY